MNSDNPIIDSEVAAMLLGTSKDNVRQLVRRKQLVPTGRQHRRNTFLLSDVLALQTRRGSGKKETP